VKIVSHPKCPDCGKQFEFIRHVAIATESYPDVERNELGIPILDKDGNPTLKVRISHEYIAIPKVVTPEDMEDQLKALVVRRDPELEILEKAARMKEETGRKKKAEREQEQPVIA
jgi:diketogulonate reductase-like aldo/keto reductase